MKKQIGFIISLLILFTLIPLMSCQDIFTTSPIESLQRDPSTLTDDQLEALGAAALETNNQETIVEVYTLLIDDPPTVEEDPEAVLLIAELGLAASGMNGLVEEILEDPEAAISNIDTLIAGIDGAVCAESAQQLIDLNAAIEAGDVTGVTIPEAQLELAAIAMVLTAANEAGGVANLASLTPVDPGYDSLQTAETLAGLVSGGVLSAMVESLDITL